MHTILITVPVQKDKKQELLDLIRSPIGHPFTKTNKGFISAESGFTEDEEGNVVWNLWEAWENKEDFDNYGFKSALFNHETLDKDYERKTEIAARKLRKQQKLAKEEE